MVDRFERFSFAISEISRCWHKLAAEEMEKYGLRGPHCLYLLAMYHHPGGVTAPQLGELCGRDKADVSRMMAMMREKGLVVRGKLAGKRAGWLSVCPDVYKETGKETSHGKENRKRRP